MVTTVMSTSRPCRYPSVRGTDDYITARAANPRTGMISPSLHNLSRSSSPTKSRTPQTPGEALELYGIEAQERSIVAENAAVVAFAEGAETVESGFAKRSVRRGGIKSILSKMRRKKKGEEDGSDQHTTQKDHFTTSQPEERSPSVKFDGEASAQVVETQEENPDRFVVPMPSALEPQPYKYSPAQRQAYSYYLQKTWTAQDAEELGPHELSNYEPVQRPSLETNAMPQPRTPLFDRWDPVTEFDRSIAGLEMARRVSYGLLNAANVLAKESNSIARVAVPTGTETCNIKPQSTNVKWMRRSDWNQLPRVALIHPSQAATPRQSPSVSPFERNETRIKHDEIYKREHAHNTSLLSNLVVWIWTTLMAMVVRVFCTLPSLTDLRLLTRALDIELPGEVRFRSLKSGLAAVAHVLVVYYTGIYLYQAFKVVFDFVGLLLFPVKILLRILWWMLES